MLKFVLKADCRIDRFDSMGNFAQTFLQRGLFQNALPALFQGTLGSRLLDSDTFFQISLVQEIFLFRKTLRLENLPSKKFQFKEFLSAELLSHLTAIRVNHGF